MNAHQSFFKGFADRIRPPIFSATLVACLLTRQYEPVHLVLLAVGIGLMWIGHWSEYHRRNRGR